MRRWLAGWMLGLTAAAGAAPLTGTHWIIPSQGWYSLEAAAPGAARVQIVDRAAGPVADFGLEQDLKVWKHRYYGYFEPGDYQIRVTSDAGVNVSLDAVSFTPVNLVNGGAPDLGDGATVRTKVSDGQSLVWHVAVAAGQERLQLAVRGRNVASVALWREEIWDQGIVFEEGSAELQPKMPQGTFEIDQNVAPGHYTLVVNGGPKRVWGNELTDEPAVVARGGKPLPSGAIRDIVLDTDGRSEWQVSSEVTLVLLEAGAGEYQLATGPRRFRGQDGVALSAKEPNRVIGTGVRGSWVVVKGPPGARVRLRALTENRPVYGTGRSTSALVAVQSSDLSSGYPLTGYVLNTFGTASLLSDQSVPLGPATPLHLATNNLQSSEVLVKVDTAGSYSLFERQPGKSSFQLRLLDDVIRGTNVRPLEAVSGQTVSLQAKYYLLRSSPKNPGRNEWALVGAGVTQGLTASGLWDKPTNKTAEAWTVLLPPNTSLTLLEREGAPTAYAARVLDGATTEWPVIALAPGQVLDLPGKGSWELRTTSEGGSSVGARAAATARGVSLSAPGGGIVELARVVTLPAVDHDAVPLINAGSTQWADWARGETKRFDLRVAQPGLYRVETQGRLSMSVTVRKPLVRSLLRADENFGGTNARLYAFLNPGLYRVEVASQDGTTGRAGLTLLQDQNFVERALVPGSQARATVPADQLLRVTVTVPRAGDYLVTSLGLNQDFPRRFEDPEGYPVAAALENGGGTWKLAAGTYRLYSYPLPTPSRRLYGLVDLAPKNLPATTWNHAFQAKWKETPERTPDRYEFDSPSPLLTQVLTSSDMVWEAWQGTRLLDRAVGGDPHELSIPAGKTVFLVRTKSPDNLRDYSFEVRTRDLTPGRSIVLVPNTPVPLSVGKAGVYELGTWGRGEGRLFILGENGQVIAQGVPRTDDWNPVVTASLQPGRYYGVYVSAGAEPVLPPPQEEQPESYDEPSYDEESYDDESYDDESEGYDESYAEETSSADAVDQPPSIPAWTLWTEARYPGDAGQAALLTFAAREVAPAPAMTLGTVRERWGSTLRSRTFVPDAGAVYRLSSDAGRQVLYRVERQGKLLAQGAGTLLIPLKAKTEYQITTWWEDPTDGEVALTLAAADVRSLDQKEPQSMLLASGTLASAAWEAPLTEAPGGWISSDQGTLWWQGSETPSVPDWPSGKPLAVPLGDQSQILSLEVPAGSVALVKASGGGRPVLLSTRSGDWNWGQSARNSVNTVLGLGPGKSALRVWNPEAGALLWADVSWTAFPAQTAAAASGTLAPGRAVLGKSAGSLDVVLDDGLVAFSLDTGRPLVADGPTAGTIANGSWVIVNPTNTEHAWRVKPVDAKPALVSDQAPYEVRLDEPTDIILDVAGTGAVRAAFQGADEALWGASGNRLWSKGDLEKGPAGERRAFAGAKGTLFLKGVRGWLRVWTGQAEALGFDSPKGSLVGDVRLPAGSQAWTFTPPKAGFYSFDADGGGILAVTGSSGVLASSWDTTHRSLLVRLGTSAVTVAARPFVGGAQSGSLRVSPLTPLSEGTQLIAAHERQLWPITVKAPGRVGLGVKADRDAVNLRLFDPNFQPVASGPLLWRDLNAGTYWLVVEAEETLRYRPIFLGLEGSRLGVPDDVRESFEQGMEP